MAGLVSAGQGRYKLHFLQGQGLVTHIDRLEVSDMSEWLGSAEIAECQLRWCYLKFLS